MFPKKSSVCLLVLTLLVFSKAAFAQLTGTGVRSPHFAEALLSSDLRYPDGRLFSSLPILLVCVDITTSLPPNGPISYMDSAGTTALRGGSGPAGVAAIHWLFDQYYDSHFKNGNSQQQWAFQYAVWEIGNDFDGSVSSLNHSAGLSIPSVDGYFGTGALFGADALFIDAYQTIYQAMISALPGLSPAYRSQTYTLDLFKNTVPSEQDMVALIEIAPSAITPIPTLGPWALALLAALVGAFSWGKVGTRPRRY